MVKGQKYQLKYIHEDDKYTGAQGVAAANKLIFDDKVKFIVGPFASASILAFQPICESNKVIVICDGYMGPEVLRGKKYTFRANAPPVHVAGPFMQWLKEKYPDLKRGAHIAPNDATGWGSSQFDNDAIVASNMEVVANEYYERGTQDFTSTITRILAKKPDFLAMGGTPPGEAALIIKQAREFGFKGVIQHTGMTDPATLGPIAGWENVEGVMSTSVAAEGPAVPQGLKDFFRNFKAKYDYYDDMAPHFYPVVTILVYGIKKADSLDPDKIVEALENLGKFETIWGKGCYFGGKELYGIDHQLIRPFQISQIRNGKLVGIAMPMSWEVPPPMQKWR